MFAKFSFLSTYVISFPKHVVLNYKALVCKNKNKKLPKIVVESTATSNSTHTTKIIQK